MAAILLGYHGKGESEWKKVQTFYIPNDLPFLTG